MYPIQQRVFSEIESCVERGMPVPTDVLDIALRTHPIDYLHAKDDEDSRRTLEVAYQKLGGHEAEVAWWRIRFVGEVVARSFAELEPTAMYVPAIAYDRSDSNLSRTMELVNRRVNTLAGNSFNATSHFVSRELVDGVSDKLSTPDILSAWIDYVDDAGLPQAMIRLDKFIDTDSDRAEAGESVKEPKIIVAIPAISGEEHDTLRRTLKLLARQSLDPDDYQIVILHNAKVKVDETELQAVAAGLQDRKVVVDNTLEAHTKEMIYSLLACEDTLRQYPATRIKTWGAVVEDRAQIGAIRAMLHALIAANYLEQGWTGNPLVLNLDADVTSLNHTYLEEMVKAAEASDKPVVASRLKWGMSEGLHPTSLVTKYLRYERFLSSVREAAMGSPVFTDCGTAIRLRDYCLAGGHFVWDEFYENGRIVHVLERFRGPDQVALSKRSVHGSDPRRQIDVMARGHSSHLAWNQEITSFGDKKDPVRTQRKPIEAATLELGAHIEEWIPEITKRYLGDPDGERFQSKLEVTRKGLKILGLPDVLPDFKQ